MGAHSATDDEIADQPLHRPGADAGVVTVASGPRPRLSWYDRVEQRLAGFWGRKGRRRSNPPGQDPLTGLPGRDAFLGAVETALKTLHGEGIRRRAFTVLYLDIDRFKQVNDAVGQEAGDELLVTIAHRILAVLGPRGLAARIGSDHFAVLIEGLGSHHGAMKLANRLKRRIEHPFTLRGQEIFPTASLGVTVCADRSLRAEDIVADATLAMALSKLQGRGVIRFFEPGMRNGTSGDALALESDLRRALERGELELFYQPIIRLDTNEVAGFEALMRWRHPERGIIPPAAFIPIAEELGAIVEMGDWALGEACRQLAAWQRRRPSQPPLFVSVNISRRQLEGSGIADSVRIAVATSGIAPGSLQLEITESLIMDRPDYALELLRKLKAIGVGISIDDFGTGYSSLSRLHRLPFDTLKIDRSFVIDMLTDSGSGVIVQAVVDLAHALKLKVVAEGAERPEDVEALRRAGCEFCQGDHLGSAMPAREVEERWLAHLAEAPPQVRAHP